MVAAAGTRRRRRVLPLLIVLVVVAAVAVAAHHWTTGPTAQQTTKNPEALKTFTPRSSTLPAADIARLTKDLTSGRPSTVAADIAVPHGVVVPPSVIRTMRTLAPLRISANTWTLTGPGIGTVQAQTARGSFAMTLVKVGSEWKLLTTRRLS